MLKEFKVEVRITDEEENYDAIFTNNNITDRNSFLKFLSTMFPLLPNREPTLTFNELNLDE